MQTPFRRPAATALVALWLGLSSSGCDHLPEDFGGTAKSVDHAHAPHPATHGEEEAGGQRHGSESGHGGEGHPSHKILATQPVIRDVVSTQQYVCQLHSQRHIEVRALESGYLEEIKVREGQSVNQGDLLFQVVPTLYQARLESEAAEAQLAQIEYDNSARLYKQKIVSKQEVALAKAKLDKAKAKVKLAQAEVNFTHVTAPFSGIIDRLMAQQGSLVAEGDVLTTLSDNSVMWAYFNVPEARYLDYKTDLDAQQDLQVEMVLANGKTFEQPGEIGAIEADFNNETGNIAFRADFPNPTRLLRHGQTGTVLINRMLANAIVIPQRATFETLDKQYVYVIDQEDIVHQKGITVASEQDDIYLIEEGLTADDKIVLEGIRQVRDGEKITYEMRDPVEVLEHLKYSAE